MGLTIAGSPAVPFRAMRCLVAGTSPYQVRISCMKRGLKLEEETALEWPPYEAQVRQFIDAAWPRNALDEPQVKHWRAAGRVTLLLLLASSALQYYFLDVYLTIMAMPQVTLVASLP